MTRKQPWLLWIGWALMLSACHRQPATNEYFCQPTVAYTMDGAVDLNRYAVERACYRSMTEKQKACYTEVR
jgi:hypothetical protein